MTVRHSSWAERVYGPSLKKSCCKACTKKTCSKKRLVTQRLADQYMHTYMYTYIYSGSSTPKSATFMAVALHLMVQKPTSAWLVDGWRHTFVSTWEPPTSSCFVVLDRCCHRAPKGSSDCINNLSLLPVAVSGRNPGSGSPQPFL